MGEGSEGPRAWMRSAVGRIPTAWLITAGAGLLLASTAAFGGLATVADDPPRLTAGGEYAGAGFEMSVVRADIVDAYANLPAEAQLATHRVLRLEMDVENTGVFPRNTDARGSVREVEVRGFPGPPGAILRADDRTFSPWLQPGVPSRLVLVWVVPRDTPTGELELALPLASQKADSTRQTAWAYDGVGAYVTLPLTDGGAGDAEPAEDPVREDGPG
ncbi:hypothetical protein [Microbacterium resistens]